MISEKIVNEVQYIFLAGGKGTRMNVDHPKVLSIIPGADLTLLEYLLKHLSPRPEQFKYRPIIVTGYKSQEIIAKIGPGYDYAFQEEQLGTGHAVAMAKDLIIERNPKHVVVAYGDMPFFSIDSVYALITEREKFNAPVAMATQKFDDFLGYNKSASKYGRVVRDRTGQFVKIVEFKDASDSEKEIKEVSSAHYAFDAEWLFENIVSLDNNNVQGEYYLTALPTVALSQGQAVVTVETKPIEALGANTQEELASLGELLDIIEN